MSPLKELLGDIVYGLHSSIGITAPPPEKRLCWFFVWLGILLFFLVPPIAVVLYFLL